MDLAMACVSHCHGAGLQPSPFYSCLHYFTAHFSGGAGAVQTQYAVDVKGRKLIGSLASPGRGGGVGALHLLLPCPSSSLCRFLCVIGILVRHLMVTSLRPGELALSGHVGATLDLRHSLVLAVDALFPVL